MLNSAWRSSSGWAPIPDVPIWPRPCWPWATSISAWDSRCPLAATRAAAKPRTKSTIPWLETGGSCHSAMVSGRLGRSDEDRPILSEDPVRRVRHDRAYCGVDLRPLRQHRGPTADWRFPEQQSGDCAQHCQLERRPDRPQELFGPPVHHRPIRRDLRHLLRLRRGREGRDHRAYLRAGRSRRDPRRLQEGEGRLRPHTRGPRKLLGGHGRYPRRRGRLRACRHGQGLHRLAGPDGHWQGGLSPQHHPDRQRAGVLRADVSGVAAARSSPGLRLAFVVRRAARVAPGFLPGQASARAYRRGGRARPDNPLGFGPGVVSMHPKERVPNRWLIATMCTVLQLCLGTLYASIYFPRLLAKSGPRTLAVAGGLLFGAGYALAAVALAVKSLTLFYLGYGAVAGIGIGLGYVTPMSTVTKWFPDKKGLMTGIVAMGFGLGAFVLSVVLAPILMHLFHRNLALVFRALG